MKFFTVACILGLSTLAAAGHIHGHASSYASVVKHDAPHHHEHHAPAHHGGWEHHAPAHHHEDHHHDHHSGYKFEYGVKDSHTGDNKDQWEHSDGHHLKGSYELHEADGTKRVVKYSDNGNGLEAHVERIGHAKHPQVYGHDGHHGHNEHHGHGHAESYANSNLYDKHHH